MGDANLRTLAVIGTGLMGGSLALAARARGLVDEVVGYDLRSDRLEAALERGALTGVAADPNEAVESAGLVMIATPVSAIPEAFATIAPHLVAGAIVSDVGSTKARIVSQIEKDAVGGAYFIGGHPLAGGEQEGIEAARPDLYEGCVWFLCPTETTDPGAIRSLVRFVTGLGASVMSLDPARHDELVALTSHLPQLLASALMGFTRAIAESEGGPPLVAAGGFRDMTRIAASSPGLWVDILRENRSAVLGVLERFGEHLSSVRRLIEGGDWEGVEGVLSAASAARRTLAGKPGVAAEALVALAVPVPDEPGVLSTVTTTLGEAGVNIEDIDIVHSPSGGRGTLVLTLNGEESARLATKVLGEKGFVATKAGTL